MLALRHETLARVSLRRRERWRYAAAAAGIAAVLAGGGWLAFGPGLPGLAPARPAKVASTLYETGPGQRTTVMLPDGSVAELDARSRLRASFAPGVRQLQLETGQALFQVARDPRRPFVVHAGGEAITAHGTRFNVRLADRRLEVALIEGRVAVTSAGGARQTEMAPHDLLRIEDGARSIEKVQNIERFASWREGLVVLENTRLGDALAEINRYAPQPIRLADPGLMELRLSGAFRVDRTDVFVEALELYFGLHVVARTPDEIVLGAKG
jgi:transmembrane sensor